LGTNFVADPVDVVTGAFYVDEVDLTLPGPFPLQIRRNYSNQNPLPGLFGFGWKLRNLKQEISGNQTISTWFNTLGQPLKIEDGLTTILYRYVTSVCV